MSSSTPIVVAVLHSDADDIDYKLYGAAYGIEMEVDDDWNAEAILLVPHANLNAMVTNTGVVSADTRIISAGATDFPISDRGSPSVSAIGHHKTDWVLVGDPRRKDTEEQIARKLNAALDKDYRMIICFDDTTREHIATRITGLASSDCSRIVIALVHPCATQPDVAVPFAKSVRTQLEASGASGRPRVIVSGVISGEGAKTVVGMDGIDGVFLMEDKYEHWGLILEMLRALGE